ncbi:uncharacterized protein LOC128554098 [Mercenaria mercenaria]|uniref:uncharacterized protein LOC128554098 n=1 Tax=Mercenaria mercenaria TaxID=6596 RepID=UPI00234F52D5|nr:uncharacterized protein LOC128554098 [Mercenaria mercenaria]
MWLYLSLLKSKMMADNNKSMSSIFEGVKQTYHETLQPEMNDMLVPYLRDFTIEKLGPFVEVLHEYILLFVAVEENIYEEDYIDIKDKLLRDYLYVYIDDWFEEEDTDIVMNIAGDLPPEILNIHSVPLWMMAYKILREKQTGEGRL